MTDEEKQVHLNNVIKILSDVKRQVEGMDYNQFSQEEYIYQEVYKDLQNVGRAAHMLYQTDDVRLVDKGLGVLSNFRNARYNGVAEIDHHPVWSFLTSGDLEEILDDLEEASAELGRTHEEIEDERNRLSE